MKEVYEFLDKLDILIDEKIIVAVSFGPDSMALLNILKNKFNKANIICAHVHHNHRKESDEEAALLEKYCKKNNISFEMMKIESYSNDKFTEEEARKKRYAFFDKVILKYNARYLFTAHHGDDLVETVLMRLTRGSSLKGYYGIPLIANRGNYKLIRPLLYVAKENIIKYCTDNNISYALDKSNNSDDYARNRYRKYILPVLKGENINVHKQFLKFSAVLQEYDDYLARITEELYKKIIKDNVINLTILLKQDNLIIKRILMKYLFMCYGNKINKLTDVHITGVLKLIKSNKPNASISLPGGIKLIKSYNMLYFDKNLYYNDYCFMFDDYVSLPNGYVVKKIETLENTTNYVTAFNKDDIAFPIYVRNKINGDKMEVLGLNGSKKINDIYITEKIDKEKRNSYPIVVDSMGKIIWLPGLKKSKYDKSKQGNYDIILKYQKEDKYDTE